MKLNNHKKEITFDEKNHKYTNNSGNQLISVSTLISKYKEPFDADGKIAVRCAEKEGITKEEILAKWEKTKNDACTRGISFHKQAEYYILNKKILDEPDKDIIEKFSKIQFSGKLFTEEIVYSLKDMIAGTVDLIEVLGKNKCNLYDFKTNKKLEKYSFWRKKMLYPVSHIIDCNFYHYSLQLSLYAYLLEEHGFWAEELKIFYINPKTREIEVHPVDYLRNDVIKLIKHHKGVLPKPIKEKTNDFFDY